MASRYDVVVLGAGNAGMAAAGVVRQHGRSVAIVDHRPVGGTCPLRGCVPKKVLVAAAEAMDEIRKAGRHKIEVATPTLDWGALIDREQLFTEGVPQRFERTLKEQGIDLYKGTACFLDRNRVTIDGEALEAGKTVIATGSKVRPLPMAGAEHLITSDDLLTDRALPESLIFIGGGFIALEFSHVLARAGCKVTILEAAARLLSAADRDAAAKVREATEDAGIDVFTDVEVEEIIRNGDGFDVRFRHEGETRSLRAQRVVNGTGRIPDVEDLDLDAAGIEHEGPRIALTEHLRSVSNPDAYAAGDTVSGSAQLSPLATYEGEIAGENIVNGDHAVPDYLPVPSVVFAIPALASVGLTEEQASEKGCAFEVKATEMGEWLSSRLYGGPVAYSKVLIDSETDRVLGAHIVGKRSEEIIHLFALAMKHGITRESLRSMVYAFPTFASDVKSMV